MSAAPYAGDRVVKVYLMHDCPIVRAGLSAILSGQEDLDVSAPAQWPAADEACVVIADYASVMQAARLKGQPARLMVFTPLRKECQVLRAMEHGVLGYLVQECPAEDVLAGVRAVAQGTRYLCAAARMGVVTPKTLARNRKYAVLGAFIAAAALTPTPDAFNQMLMAGPLIILYEVGIVSARIFGRRTPPVPVAEKGAA